jgi:hypothetical protein
MSFERILFTLSGVLSLRLTHRTQNTTVTAGHREQEGKQSENSKKCQVMSFGPMKSKKGRYTSRQSTPLRCSTTSHCLCAKYLQDAVRGGRILETPVFIKEISSKSLPLQKWRTHKPRDIAISDTGASKAGSSARQRQLLFKLVCNHSLNFTGDEP